MQRKSARASTVLSLLTGAAAGLLLTRILRPASTPPVRKKKGARSIARLEKVNIGGTEQWILIRSEDVVNNPILLILHGGPGTGEMALQRRYTRELERYFTVVNWDQRGAGKSYEAGSEESKMTIERFIEDTRELTLYLQKRFGKEKVFLQGRSWGSALGMLTVSKYPELFYAYVGIGQITNMAESEQTSYRWTLHQARTNGDRKALRELEEMGPPPYSGDWLKKFNSQRKYVAHYGGEVLGNPTGGNGKILDTVLFAPEYTLSDRLNYKQAVTKSMKLLHPQLMEVNLFQTAPAVDVPVFLAEGRYDHVVSAQLAARYFELLEAPIKALKWFEQSAHMPDIEESSRFNQWLVEAILPLASSGESGRQLLPDTGNISRPMA